MQFSPEMNTPWGEIQSYGQIANGIIAVSTGEHGGLWLSEKRVNQLPSDYKPFTGDKTWAEEDVDAPKVLKLLKVKAPENLTWTKNETAEPDTCFVLRKDAKGEKKLVYIGEFIDGIRKRAQQHANASKCLVALYYNGRKPEVFQPAA